MKVTMLQNHHFYLLLPLIQPFSKMRDIFNRATSEARSKAVPLILVCSRCGFRKQNKKIGKKTAGKACPYHYSAFKAYFQFHLLCKAFSQWFLYMPIPTLEELLTLSFVWGWSEVYWSSRRPLHLWCPALTSDYFQEQSCLKGFSLPELSHAVLGSSLKPQLCVFTSA